MTSKKISSECLTDILTFLEQGQTQSQIAEKTGLSKQRISYWIRKLKKLHLIEELPESSRLARFYRVKIPITMGERVLQRSIEYSPHNFGMKFKLLNPEKVDYAQFRKGQNMVNWTKYFDETKLLTIEITPSSVVCYLRIPFIDLIDKPEDIDKADKRIKDLITEDIKDWSNRKLIDIEQVGLVFRQEIGVKDPIFDKIPDDVRIRNDVFKKVYPNKVEFYSPDDVKTYIKNRTIEDWSPELVKELSDIKGLLGGMLPQNVQTANAIMLIAQNLRKLTEKESFFDKIRKLWRRK